MLHIVKNYTGDVLNFEMAAELAAGRGHRGRSVVIDDDVAVQDSLYTAGRRGVGATVLAEKIAGAAAEERRPLEEVADICREVNANGRSMGMALTSCTVPAAGKPTFELGDDEMEIGIGIHGEPGRERDEAGARRTRSSRCWPTPIVDDLPVHVGRQRARLRQRHGRHAADRALHRLQRAARRSSRSAGSTIARNLVGNYITSLEMAGCSITLLQLDDELTRLWDAPVQTPGLRWGA